MPTKDFATRTMTIARKNVTVPNTFLVALDVGYSAVKGFSPNKVYCFPSAVHETKKSETMMASKDKILYEDEDGLWCVGDAAMKMFTSRDNSTSDSIMFARQRYNTKEFLVMSRVGIAIGMIPNEFGSVGNKRLILQTGLPPKYVRPDAPLLRESLSGKHKFRLKVGEDKWRDFDFSLSPGDIYIMSQPVGSLYSISLDRNARQITSAGDYFGEGSIIFDGGFGTLDVFSVRSDEVEESMTLSLSMREVIKRTCDDLYNLSSISVEVYELLAHLAEGRISKFDIKKKVMADVDFSKTLSENNKRVCQEALDKLDSIYNYMQDYKYLIVAGGTGEAWLPMIRSRYSQRGIEVIPSTQNDNLLGIYSNVRGYYMFRIGKLKRGE